MRPSTSEIALVSDQINSAGAGNRGDNINSIHSVDVSGGHVPALLAVGYAKPLARSASHLLLLSARA